MSYVYFILDIVSNSIKIGKANDIQERLSGLQTGNPNELLVLHYIKCDSAEFAFNLERKCHNEFNHLHMRGEWFKYDKEAFQKFLVEEINFKKKPNDNMYVSYNVWIDESVDLKSLWQNDRERLKIMIKKSGLTLTDPTNWS